MLFCYLLFRLLFITARASVHRHALRKLSTRALATVVHSAPASRRLTVLPGAVGLTSEATL